MSLARTHSPTETLMDQADFTWTMCVPPWSRQISHGPCMSLAQTHSPTETLMDQADFALTMCVPPSETLMVQADFLWTMQDPASCVWPSHGPCAIIMIQA